MKTKAINSQTTIEFFCYLLFAGMTLYLLLSGKYLSYVTPRMKPYLYFAAGVMLLWAVFSLAGLFRPQRRKRIAHCFVLIIPVLLLLLPHGEVGVSNLSGSASPLTGSTLHSLTAPRGSVPSGKPSGALSAVPPLKKTASSGESSPAGGTASRSESSAAGEASSRNEASAAGGTAPRSESSAAGEASSRNEASAASGTAPQSEASAASGTAPQSEASAAGEASSRNEASAASGTASQSEASAAGGTAPGSEASAPPQSTSKAPASPGVYEGTDPFGQKRELHGYDEANRTITVGDDEFYAWLSEFSTNLAAFEGFQVTITGAVYKDPDFLASNEFIPARLMMTCCTADLAPTGIVCNYAKAPGLETGDWITVSGTLYRGQYEGEDEPQLKVTSIVPAQPVKGYVYPF